MTWLVALAGVGALVAGGAFLVFSTLVPGGLNRLEDAEAAAAMQQINVAAPKSPIFMLVIFGPGLLALMVAAWAVADWSEPGAPTAFVGALIHLLGVVGMTIVFHVPRNVALGQLATEAAADEWRDWIRSWTLGNHVRAAAGIAAGVLLLWSQR